MQEWKVWVDTGSGTYGLVDENCGLVIIDITLAEMDAFDEMADTERMEWAWQAVLDGKGKVVN